MSARLVAGLLDYADGDQPVSIALTRLLTDCAAEPDARQALRDAAALRTVDAAAAGRLTALHDLWASHPEAFATVRGTLRRLIEADDATPGRFDIADWARAFDRVVGVSPEASVAIYSLGSPALLDAATEEVRGWMEARGLLGMDRDALDLGCGIGRFLVALSGSLRSVLGTDISPGMVAEARRRCAALTNVAIRQVEGRALSGIADRSFDLVLAADVMPYLVEVGGGLVRQHLDECRRVLRPGGHMLVLNYAYRGTYETRAAELSAETAASGLGVAASIQKPFATWDAEAFLLRRA